LTRVVQAARVDVGASHNVAVVFRVVLREEMVRDLLAKPQLPKAH